MDERAMERASAIAEAEREAFVRRARAVVNGPARMSDDCLNCGDPIPAARLSVMPTAKRCIHCERAAV